jgi:hypothetical protein
MRATTLACCAERRLDIRRLLQAFTMQALGVLEPGLGHPAVAVEHYSAHVSSLHAHGHRGLDLSPAPEFVDALPPARPRPERWGGGDRVHDRTADASRPRGPGSPTGSPAAQPQALRRADLRAAVGTFECLGVRRGEIRLPRSFVATGETTYRRNPNTAVALKLPCVGREAPESPSTASGQGGAELVWREASADARLRSGLASCARGTTGDPRSPAPGVDERR